MLGIIGTAALLYTVKLIPSRCVAQDSCSDATTKFTIKQKKVKRCKWAQKYTSKRCTKFDIVQDSCPKTCLNCCEDSQEQFTIFNGKNRTCSWVSDKPLKRCGKKASIQRLKCPIACEVKACINSSNRLESIEDLTYTGSFRVNGVDVDYPVGIIAHGGGRNSIFFVGFEINSAIAEFPIPDLFDEDPSSLSDNVSELPEVVPMQTFVRFLDQLTTDEGINRITGMLVINGQIIVNAENWYDATGSNTDTTFVIRNASDLSNSQVNGYFKMNGATQSAGYLGLIPEEWKEHFGGSNIYTGWSSVHSIVSRYSIGPSLWTFQESDLLNGGAVQGSIIPTESFMNFPFSNITDRLGDISYASQGTTGPFDPTDPLWNILSKGVYGFFVPGSNTFLVIGSTGGLETGVGYKAVQDDGTQCGGPCPYAASDNYNYYWMFDIDEILSAGRVSEPRPYSYGIWNIPFDDNGLNYIMGGTFDPVSNTLYVVLENAGSIGPYDRRPLIATFSIPNISRKRKI